MMSRTHERTVLFLICALAALAAMHVARWVQPNIVSCRQEYQGASDADCSVPYLLLKEHTTAYIEFSLLRRAGAPVSYQIAADDCIDHLQVNDRLLISRDTPLCAYPQGQIFDLSGIVREGENRVRVLLRNGGGFGQLLIRPAPGAPQVLIREIGLLAVFVFGSFAVLFGLTRRHHGIRAGMDGVGTWLIIGFAFRLLYYFSTPYWSRAYDWNAHLEYVIYVLDHWSIPPASGGWEHYQPPLYYFTAALFQRIFGPSWSLPVELGINLTGYSLLLSGAVLLTMLAACEELTVGFKPALRFGLMGAVALFPGVVFFSTRITNDQLQLLSGVLLLFISLRLGRSRRPLMLAVMAGLTAGLGLLSKTSAGALLPLPILALWLNRDERLKARLQAALIYVSLAALILAPYLYLRHIVEGEQGLLGRATIESLNPALTLRTELATFAVFNPLEVLQTPYNDPWNDAGRRQWFWEYLYRSAFSGELNLGERVKPTVQLMLGAGLVVLLLSIFGLAFSLFKERKDKDLVVASALALNLLALIAFRIGYPYSPCQDFRHIPTVMLPLVYFASCVPARALAFSVVSYACSILAGVAFYLLLIRELPPVHVF